MRTTNEIANVVGVMQPAVMRHPNGMSSRWAFVDMRPDDGWRNERSNRLGYCGVAALKLRTALARDGGSGCRIPVFEAEENAESGRRDDWIVLCLCNNAD